MVSENLPTYYPVASRKCCGKCPGHFLEVFKKVPAHLLEMSQSFSEMSPGCCLEVTRKSPGNVAEMSQKFPGNVQEIVREMSFFWGGTKSGSSTHRVVRATHMAARYDCPRDVLAKYQKNRRKHGMGKSD